MNNKYFGVFILNELIQVLIFFIPFISCFNASFPPQSLSPSRSWYSVLRSSSTMAGTWRSPSLVATQYLGSRQHGCNQITRGGKYLRGLRSCSLNCALLGGGGGIISGSHSACHIYMYMYAHEAPGVHVLELWFDGGLRPTHWNPYPCTASHVCIAVI